MSDRLKERRSRKGGGMAKFTPRICSVCNLEIKPGQGYRAELGGDEHNSLYTCIALLRAALDAAEARGLERAAAYVDTCVDPSSVAGIAAAIRALGER